MSDIRLSLDPARRDITAIHAFLPGTYWSPGITVDVVARAIAGSVCVGAFDGSAEIGFARLVTDRATFAYLADVYVLAPYRGRRLARQMLDAPVA
jgi:GNAT superfamily N-acetyltransferase